MPPSNEFDTVEESAYRQRIQREMEMVSALGTLTNEVKRLNGFVEEHRVILLGGADQDETKQGMNTRVALMENRLRLMEKILWGCVAGVTTEMLAIAGAILVHFVTR